MVDRHAITAAVLLGVAGVAGASASAAAPLTLRPKVPADTIVACTPSRPALSPADTVTLRASADPPLDSTTTTTWNVTAGRLLENGATARWLLSEAGTGRFTARARVMRGDALVGSCSVQVVLTPPANGLGGLFLPPIGGRGGSLPSAGVFLARGATEAPGYGAYSYLLLGAPPTPERRPRVRAAIARYLAVAQDIVNYDGRLPRAGLSVNYIPVNAPLRWARAATDTTFADTVLAHYQYATAQTLLAWFDGAHLDGPYLVTVPAPLSTVKPVKERMIFQDLSRVTSDQLVPAWVDTFLAQSKQQQWGDPSAWQRFPLLLRTAIGSVALGIPQVKAAMKDWAGWLDSWSSAAKADVP